MKNRPSPFWLFCLVFVQNGWCLDYLEPGKEHQSPDARWKVMVVKQVKDDDLTAEFRILKTGDSDSTLLCKNGRHFGAEWSPDSKTLLVYDNFGSGSSDVNVFRLTSSGWKPICQTRGEFHVIWRLAKWFRGGVQLHAEAGGSDADVPPDFSISFDIQHSKNSSERAK